VNWSHWIPNSPSELSIWYNFLNQFYTWFYIRIFTGSIPWLKRKSIWHERLIWMCNGVLFGGFSVYMDTIHLVFSSTSDGKCSLCVPCVFWIRTSEYFKESDLLTSCHILWDNTLRKNLSKDFESSFGEPFLWRPNWDVGYAEIQPEAASEQFCSAV
jgi:hypothetical protein